MPMAGRTRIAFLKKVDSNCTEAGYSLAKPGAVHGMMGFLLFVFGPLQKLFVNLPEPRYRRGLA